MNKLIPGLLCCLLSPIAEADYSEPFSPIDEQALAQISSFIPDEWKAIALAQGDLNSDNKNDYALVIQAMNPDNIRPTNSGGELISTSIDTNPRHLLLLFANAPSDEQGADSRYSRKRIYRRFIPTLSPESPDMNEPLSYIAINEGLLEIKFKAEGIGESWERNDLTYQFAYQKTQDRFMLISHDLRTVNRISAMFEQNYLDLTTGELIKTSGSMSSPRHRKDQELLQISQHWTPCDIKQPLSFNPITATTY